MSFLPAPAPARRRKWREGITITELCTAINTAKPRHLSLTAAIRVAVLQYYMDAATEPGHIMAGHGGLPAGFDRRLQRAPRKSPAHRERRRG